MAMDTIPEPVRIELTRLPNNFFGTVEICYQRGQVSTIKVTSVKRADLDYNQHEMRGTRDAKTRY
jgi:hypothetical protein